MIDREGGSNFVALPQPHSALAWIPPLVVWGVFAAMLVLAVRGVALYASPIPRWDDLGWVEALASDSGLDPAWLWSAHNDHRLPLPRLIGVPIARAAGDLRAVLHFDVALLGAVAASMIAALRRLRGSTELSDAAFPLLLLTPGASEMLLVLQGITYILPIALLGSILALVAWRRDALGPRRALAIATCTFLLPLCGGPGLVTAPLILAWMLVVGWRARGSDHRPSATSLVLWIGTAATAILIALYFVGFEHAPRGTWNPSWTNVCLQATQFLTLGLGPSAATTWPWSAAPLLLLAIGATVALARAWLTEPQERVRVSGIATLILAVI
ncbi:MAG TPA: hypothetical protein VM509_09075, partial [Planctomycetota bacterium]|nr:hypothetical protein [Planctomycetota bacterium]